MLSGVSSQHFSVVFLLVNKRYAVGVVHGRNACVPILLDVVCSRENTVLTLAFDKLTLDFAMHHRIGVLVQAFTAPCTTSLRSQTIISNFLTPMLYLYRSDLRH